MMKSALYDRHTVENAAVVHRDTAELYYQFIGDEWEQRTDYARLF